MGKLSDRLNLPGSLAILLLFSVAIGFLPNSTFYVFLKALLLLAGAATIYLFIYPQWTSLLPSAQETDTVENDLKIPDLQEGWYSGEEEEDIEEIFDRFLKTIFPLIVKTTVADSAVLLLLNTEKRKFYVRAHETAHPDSFTKEKFVDLNIGLPHLVFKTRNPIMENHLPDGGQLLPYYQPQGIMPRSFIGTPIFFKNRAIGVLCADSPVAENFSPEDLGILTTFGQLISIQLTSSSKLYEYETENWVVKVLYDFGEELLKLQKLENLWDFIGYYLRNKFEANRVSISQKLDEQSGKVFYIFGNFPGMRVQQVFPLNEGIVGWVLRKNQSLLVDDFSTKENYIPRFFLQENPAREYRSLLAVPIPDRQQARAVICLESFEPNAFKEQTKQILQTMAQQITLFWDKLETIRQLQVRKDESRKPVLPGKDEFESTVSELIRRSSRQQEKFSLLLLRVDIKPAIPGKAILDNFLQEFFSFVLPFLPEQHYIFRLSDALIALVFESKLLKEVLPFAQNVLDGVADTRFWTADDIGEVAVFAGAAQYPEMGLSSDVLVKNAEQAVEKAIGKGPNMLAIADKI